MRALPLKIQAKYLKFQAALLAWIACLIALILVFTLPAWLFHLLYIAPLFMLTFGNRFMRRLMRLERHKRSYSPSVDNITNRVAWLLHPLVAVLLGVGLAYGAFQPVLMIFIPLTLSSAGYLYMSAIQLSQV